MLGHDSTGGNGRGDRLWTRVSIRPAPSSRGYSTDE